MDALSDPKAYLSAQEKRAQQLKAIGIEESDIGTDVILGSGKSKRGLLSAAASSSGGGASLPGVPQKKQEDKGE